MTASVVAALLCIAAAAPLFLSSCFDEENDSIPPSASYEQASSDIGLSEPSETASTPADETSAQSEEASVKLEYGVREMIAESEDIEFVIDGTLILAYIPFLTQYDDLTNVTVNYYDSTGIKTSVFDLRRAYEFSAEGTDGADASYTVKPIRKPKSLPVVYIDTEDSMPVSDKDKYIGAVISIDASAAGLPSLDSSAVLIRGRGHSTWQWDKKPYKLKFAEKISVLGRHKAKDWCLLANWSDKSLIRNTVSLDIARVFDRMQPSGTQTPVDVFFNGNYAGVYTLGETVEAAKGRVVIDESYDAVDTGYLIEINGIESDEVETDRDYFHTDILRWIAIKSPDTSKISEAQYQFIRGLMLDAEAAIVSGEGVENHIDIDSFADWFIFTELTFNLDCAMRRSCFMTRDKGGLIKMGPVWDFDLALGNFSKDGNDYNRFATVGTEEGYVSVNWMNYLIGNNAFRGAVKRRWDIIKQNALSTALESVDRNGVMVRDSAEANFTIWKTLGIKVGYEPIWTLKYNTFESQLSYLRGFIEKRWEWLDSQISDF